MKAVPRAQPFPGQEPLCEPQVRRRGGRCLRLFCLVYQLMPKFGKCELRGNRPASLESDGQMAVAQVVRMKISEKADDIAERLGQCGDGVRHMLMILRFSCIPRKLPPEVDPFETSSQRSLADYFEPYGLSDLRSVVYSLARAGYSDI